VRADVERARPPHDNAYLMDMEQVVNNGLVKNAYETMAREKA
jgi:hypothetical protein